MGKLEVLRTELERAKESLHKRGLSYEGNANTTDDLMKAKPFEIAYQDVIEKIWPDNAWWEVTHYWDIFDAMMGGLSDEEVIDEIIKHVGPDYVDECKEACIRGAHVEKGHNMREYLEKFGDDYDDGKLWDYLKEDFESGRVDARKDIVYWYMEDLNGEWRYFETSTLNEAKEEKKLDEGTSNFGAGPEHFPLLVFYTYDEFLYNMTNDPDYPQEEQFENERDNGDFYIDWDAFENAKDTFEQKYWDENEICVLTEDDQEKLESKLDDFNEESKKMAWDADYKDDEQQYGDNLNLEDVKVNVESGYYSAAYINVEHEDYLEDLDEDFKTQQLERFTKLFKELKNEFGLTQLGLAYHASNGETGFNIIKDESLKEDESYYYVCVNLSGNELEHFDDKQHAIEWANDNADKVQYVYERKHDDETYEVCVWDYNDQDWDEDDGNYVIRLHDTYKYYEENGVIKTFNSKDDANSFIEKHNIKGWTTWDDAPTNESLKEEKQHDGKCPFCGSENIDFVDSDEDSEKHVCHDCGQDFLVHNDGHVTTRNNRPIEESHKLDKDFSKKDADAIINWWKEVEDANVAMKWGYRIDNGDYDDIEALHAAMFDMLDDLKEKGASDLFNKGKKLYNKYALSKYSEDLKESAYDKDNLKDALKELNFESEDGCNYIYKGNGKFGEVVSRLQNKFGKFKYVSEPKSLITIECTEEDSLKESCSDKELVDKLVAFGTCDSEEEAEKRVARMSQEMKDEMCKSLKRQAQDHLLNDSLNEDVEKIVSKYKHSFYNKDKNRVETGDKDEWEKIAKELNVGDDNLYGNEVDGYFIDLKKEESLEEKKSKKKYKIRYTGDPAKDAAFFNHAMGSDKGEASVEQSSVSLGEGFVGQEVDDFLDVVVEPEAIETLVISNIDADDYTEAFKGNYDDIDSNLLHCEYADFDVGGAVLVVNVAQDSDEWSDTYYDTLETLLEDYNGDEIKVVDVNTGETLFEGDKEDVDDEVKGLTFWSIDTPKYLCVNAHCGEPDEDDEEESEDDNELKIEYWYDEEARDQGLGDMYFGEIEDVEDGKRIVRKMIDRDGFASAELQRGDKVLFGYDGESTWGDENESLDEASHRGMAYYEYKGCHVRETPSCFVATDEHGTTLGDSKTKAGAEGIIDDHVEKKDEKLSKKQIDNNVKRNIKYIKWQNDREHREREKEEKREEALKEGEDLYALHVKVIDADTDKINKIDRIFVGSKKECDAKKKQLEETSPEDSHHNRNIYKVSKVK